MKQIISSWILLAYFDCLMRFGGFEELHKELGSTSVDHQGKHGVAVDALSHAVDVACVFYWKRVLCLQRSAALTKLLRRHGWCAEMVIGAQLLPFQSHAWVEFEGKVINDRPYVREMFLEMERC